jgi:outer membrane protein OmpA-like peptidoglycan-associated protein
MKNYRTSPAAGLMVATAVAAILAGCASTPEAPAGSQAVRSKLMLLKSENALAMQVPVAIEQAETAVKLAETAQPDAELAAHRVYMADHMVDTTRATAETRLAESQRAAISQQNDANRLAARTLEADSARRAAENARADAATARNEAASARDEADSARMAATTARNDAAAARTANDAAAAAADAKRQELAAQIALLQARTTERGIVLTLGDVLFATGSSDLKPGAIDNLDRLVSFLGKYPDRNAVIEGHTDSRGADAYNQELSLRRADSVRGYIAGKGVASTRLSSVGKGEAVPVASNDSAAGRQQNRRVEIVIGNDLQAAATTP